MQRNRGRLDLDDDIRQYIEDFRLFDDVEDKLSLQSLGSHLSGLGRDSTGAFMEVINDSPDE